MSTKFEQQERKNFLACFHVLFFHPSETMGVKCWRSIRDMEEGVRADLIDAMITAAKAKIVQKKAKL